MFATKFTNLLESLPLSRDKKDIIVARYVALVTSAEADYRTIRILYFILTNLITISGVFITSLVSLEKVDAVGEGGAKAIFWVVWSLAILLTLANKWVYSFNIHKKYVLNSVVVEKLRSEGWLFLAGVGRYAGHDCDARFSMFCARVEKIKTKSVANMPELENDSGGVGGILATGANSDQSTDTAPAADAVIQIVPVDNIADSSAGSITGV
jgi:hypothetical protein